MVDTKWSYMVLRTKYAETAQMNLAGKDGWEAFAVLSGTDATEVVVFYKRPSN